MVTKKRSKADNSDDKNVLYDPFLDRSIELAPSAYDVFKKEATAERKLATTKSKSDLQKPKLALKSVDSNTSSTKSTSENIKTSRTTNSRQSRGGLWSIINNDIVWFSIAFASILGVMLFYFQGLQPLILSNYIDNTHQKMLDLNDSYSGKVNNYISLRTSLSTHAAYNPAGTCADEPMYQDKQADTTQLDLLKVGLLPDPSLKDLPRYQMFYETNVNGYYNDTYQKYSDTLGKINATAQDLYSLPAFLDYRNNWIASCQKIQTSKGDLATLKSICSTLKQATTSFEQNPAINSYSDFKSRIDSGVNKCTDIETAKGTTLVNFGQWQLDWLNKYSDVMSFKPITNDLTSSINQQNQEFVDTLKKNTVKMDEVYNSRLGFWNIWYLLNY